MTNHNPLNDVDMSPGCTLLDRLASPLECLANLTFLALAEAEHPEKVRLYLAMAEEQMQVIRQISYKTYMDRS